MLIHHTQVTLYTIPIHCIKKRKKKKTPKNKKMRAYNREEEDIKIIINIFAAASETLLSICTMP